MSEDYVIGRFQKSNQASIQVSLVEWNSEDFVDIREVIPNERGGFQFTKKGIRFHSSYLKNLFSLLLKARKEIDETGSD